MCLSRCNSRKKAFKSELKLVMSPSAVMNENTSQFPFGPCFRFQVCPPTWMFCATRFPIPPMLHGNVSTRSTRSDSLDLPAAIGEPNHAISGKFNKSEFWT